MTGRYKKSILELLSNLHESKINPFENIEKWLILQEKLLSKTIYIENRIRTCKEEIKELQRVRKNPAQRLSKEESINVKSKIKELDYNIDEYHWLLLILKSIGDGIAFTFIHKLDIKPQNFKESPGFLSGKKGLILEKKILRHSFKNGLIAILNDLTSVLKYADVTMITEDGFFPIEAKSSEMDNERIRRQAEKTNKLYKYLEEDEIVNLYGEDGQIMRRVALCSDEINYQKEFSNLLESARVKGYDSYKFEDGFSCIVAFKEFDTNEVLDSVVKGEGFTTPYFFHLNMYKFMGYGYYPFSLLFNSAEHYWDFLEGNINVIVFIDFSAIEKISENYGYNVERAKMEDYAFTFKSKNEKNEVSSFSMSEHFFFRTFMEMVSLKWLLNDTFLRFKNRID
ncbi:hypothetical protein [Chryseobacterium binzhouense]|uniref:hypothetical protein n=1 Tax=Chryseobacterium binzhouense TaxID=2593646 RepID=UPI00117C33AF|nr:hypothetical protein [Chryseobacterium binzhouense]MXS71163.1 hypothetical protein [Flavobacteriaceae bacterium W22]